MTNGEALYIGLMSGTSADAIDAALVAFDQDHCEIVSTHSRPLSPALKADIHALTLPGGNEIGRMNRLDQELGEAFADAARALLHQAQVPPEQVRAIGSHGQTIRHQAGGDGDIRFSVQIGNPHIIAESTGILTVADFRRRDIVCGGQGAPLAPGFHQARFSHPREARGVVNIGGIANLTTLTPGSECLGLDTGPGNTLLDAWVLEHLGQNYDEDGRWAASAEADPDLLQRLLAHPFLALPAPKSTGREDFNLPWLRAQLNSFGRALEPAAVQATLLELTAVTIADAVQSHCPQGAAIFVCGGGAHNTHMMQRLAERLPGQRVGTTADVGLSPDWVEAAAFAWLAKQFVEGKPGNLPSVTGARRAAVLGAAYPADPAKDRESD